MVHRYSLETLTVLIKDIRELQREMGRKLDTIEENTIRHSQSYTYLQGIVLDIIKRNEAHDLKDKERDEVLRNEKNKFFVFLKDKEHIMKFIIMVVVSLIVLFRASVEVLADLVKSWIHI